MAETCTIPLMGITSRKLRRDVRRFLDGEGVVVEVRSGETYSVMMRRQNLVLISEGEPADHSQRGKGKRIAGFPSYPDFDAGLS